MAKFVKKKNMLLIKLQQMGLFLGIFLYLVVVLIILHKYSHPKFSICWSDIFKFKADSVLHNCSNDWTVIQCLHFYVCFGNFKLQYVLTEPNLWRVLKFVRFHGQNSLYSVLSVTKPRNFLTDNDRLLISILWCFG